MTTPLIRPISWRAIALFVVAATVGTLLLAVAPPARATGTTGTVTEFSAGITASSLPKNIAAGPDGNLWFTETNANKVAKISPAGVVTEFSTGITANSLPKGIAAGPDGNLWFSEQGGTNRGVARISPAGVVTEFSAGITGQPNGIAAGPDGNLWFAEFNDRVGRITPAGVATEFSAGISAGSGPQGITAGPDGNLWFTENGTNRVAKITTGGVVTQFATGITANSQPSGIVAGPDGNLWFTESAVGVDKIGRITPAGVVTEFSAGISPSSGLEGITTGADGNLWYGGNLSNKVGRITTAGTVTEFPASANSQPAGITAGPDGNLWFTEQNGNKIGTLALATAGTQATTATVVGVLSIAISSPSLNLGSLVAGANSTNLGVGNLTYTNTLGAGTAWSVTAAATSLLSGGRSIPASSLTYTPTAVSGLAGSSGTTPTNPGAAAFSFAGCIGIGDVAPGVSYSCPLTLMTASTTTQGDWSQNNNGLRLAVPAGQNGGVYSGRVQYTVTG